MRRFLLPGCLAMLGLLASVSPPRPLAAAEAWPNVYGVDAQPLAASVRRLITALELSGSPLEPAIRTELEQQLRDADPQRLATQVQKLLDPFCLSAVSINPESRVKVAAGPAPKRLMQNGWRTFLVKVHNEAGVTAPLAIDSPQATDFLKRSSGSPEPEQTLTSADVRDRWLALAKVDRQPLRPRLSGLELEYALVQLYSRDAGKREATLVFDVGQGTQDLGFRNEVPLLFDCQPATRVELSIRDHDGSPTTAALLIRDELGRVYPNPARRLAPDFFFHPQVYRHDGETVELAPGRYTIEATRGPEYLPTQRTLEIEAGQEEATYEVRLARWIDPTEMNWYSGDHHVHAAGCSHYDQPTEGVEPIDMMRHILGEDLKVGCVLSWGPCWYYQKQFFEGRTSDLSTANYLMRYDVEVSGFPSSHAGHLCLLRLEEDDYPGTSRIEEWPSWTLPVLQWAQRQGGVAGYSHSGWGLALPDYLPGGGRAPQLGGKNRGAARYGGRAADKLPDYAMPAFDGIGANEFVVTVAHGACDFISSVDTPAIWELNPWYHTLNCGYRTRISGETDFPCIYGERVGLGRVYVQLDPDEALNYERWVAGLKAGRSYCGDGLGHVLRFEADGVRLGWPGNGGETSQLDLDEPKSVAVKTSVAAWLAPESDELGRSIRARRLDEKPYWHLERCRIEGTRRVPVELIVNGEVAERREIEADGSIHDLSWDVPIERSSWVAVRILPSVHTNPIFVEVGGKPIRANRRSAEWCRRAVDVCWESKQGLIREEEKEAAREAYDFARAEYERRIAESPE